MTCSQATRVGIVATICVLVDLYMIQKLVIVDDDLKMIVFGGLLGQCSLSAIWSATTTRALLRFVVPPIVIAACWYACVRIFLWVPGESASPAWATALIAQSITIILLTKAYQALFQNREHGSHRSFDIRTLMMWTMVVAATLGFAKYGATQGFWQPNSGWSYLRAVPIIGFFDGLLAVIWLWTFMRSTIKWRLARYVVAIVCTAVIARAMSSLANWTTGADALSAEESVRLIATQVVVIVLGVAACLPVRTHHSEA